ncbi:unnamed protein product [Symbiodinium microadriaticum]|nr:unnamed protein product [Symbiodinium microadriaticum]
MHTHVDSLISDRPYNFRLHMVMDRYHLRLPLTRHWSLMGASRGSEQNASTRLAFLVVDRARMLRRSGLLCLAAPLVASKLVQAAGSFGSSKDVSKPAAAQSVVAFRGNCYDVIYDEKGGPQDLGRLVVCPYGSTTTGDVAECLDQVNRIATERIKKDIVVLLDFTDFVWPSPIMAYRCFFPIIRERLPAEELREKTQAFAIVQKERFWIRPVVDAVLLMAQPETAPIFAQDRHEASDLISKRFESHAARHRDVQLDGAFDKNGQGEIRVQEDAERLGPEIWEQFAEQFDLGIKACIFAPRHEDFPAAEVLKLEAGLPGAHRIEVDSQSELTVPDCAGGHRKLAMGKQPFGSKPAAKRLSAKMPITAEQFATTLENMTRAWEACPAKGGCSAGSDLELALPEEQRLPKDEEKSFFDDCQQTCEEMIARWHSGESSHPDREILAAEYPDSEAGKRKLQLDLFSPDVKDDPFVQAADLKLRLIKYTAPPRQKNL